MRPQPRFVGAYRRLQDYLPDTGLRSPILRAPPSADGGGGRRLGRTVPTSDEVGHSVRSARRLGDRDPSGEVGGGSPGAVQHGAWLDH